MTEQREKDAAEPPLDCLVGRLRTAVRRADPRWSTAPLLLEAAAEIERLSIHVAECEAVLRQIAMPGWAGDALASGSVERIAGDICALKRQARGVLNAVPNKK